MAQKQTGNHMRHIYMASIAMILVAALLVSSPLPVAQGYAADATKRMTGLDSHSSFHYELTRVLAKYAGLSTEQAETVAVACEATDVGSFEGYKISKGGTGSAKEAITVTIKNTERQGKNNLFYHFARRSAKYEIVKGDDKAKANTCDYFTNGNPKNPTKAPCAEKGPELDQIRNWAFGLEGAKPDANRIPRNKDGTMVTPGSPTAIGIFVHSLADSYSHEKCMIDEQLRSHPPSPFQCSPAWHVKPGGEFGFEALGISFTQTAALGVWRALWQYAHPGQDAPAAPAEVNDFVTKFSLTANACQRVQYAVNTFNSLTGETTTIECSSRPQS